MYDYLCRVDAACRESRVIQNRVAIINQTHGCRYDFAADNPCRIDVHGGSSSVWYLGKLICEYRVSEPDTVFAASQLMDAVSMAVRVIKHSGRLVTV